MRCLPWGVLLALLGACEPVTPPPSPTLLSIVPAEQSTSYPQLVTVKLDAEPRILVHYGEGSARLADAPMLWIGEREVALSTYLGHGQLQGTVPAGLEARRYDVRVALGDGREASLPEAYTVRASLPTVGYWLETIGTQRQGHPFTVTIHAAGPDSKLFTGSVRMTLYTTGNAIVSSVRTGPFSGGVRQEQLIITVPGDNYLVAVEDDEGSGATSNAFRVEPAA